MWELQANGHSKATQKAHTYFQKYDHSGRPTVTWLPYQDHNGEQFRQISLNAQDWLDQLGRNQSGSYSLYQAHEFDALKQYLQPYKEPTHDQPQ